MISSRLARIFCLLLAGALGLVLPARAQILSTLGDSLSGAIGITVGSDEVYAASFTTGSNLTGYSVSSLTVQNAVDTQGVVSQNMGIYANSGSNPNMASGTLFLQQTFPAQGNADVLYTPTTSLTLAPNTTYWLGITAGSNNTNGFEDTNKTTYTATNGWVLNSGMSYYNDSIWTTYSPTPNILFSINATALPTPEPSSWALLGLGCTALWFLRHRSRSL